MTPRLRKNLAVLAFTGLNLSLSPAFAQLAVSGPQETSTTKVGNGDDGADLEQKEKITAGLLIVTRDKAAAHLEKLGARNIPHLGNLLDEVTKAEIYLVQENIKVPKDFDKGQEVSPDGRFVYARTFARPYAPTRFFPAALMLSEQQLINLHIHEALHRALPENVREDESVVSEITLALTDPSAGFDSAKATTVAAVEKKQKAVAEAAVREASPAMETGFGLLRVHQTEFEPPVTERLKRPSFFRYSFTAFNEKAGAGDASIPVSSMHRIDNFLHPFGHGPNAVGMGLSFSYLNLNDRSYLGPLQVSGRYLLATWRTFDVELFCEHSMYTLSNEELKTLPKIRDNTTVGISMRREADRFYTENFISYTLPSESSFKVGSSQYNQRFGSITNAGVSFGGKYKTMSLGIKADLLLSQGVETAASSGSFVQEAERFRIVKFGPEFAMNFDDLQWKLYAQHIIDGTPGASLDDAADLMGHGSGQGYMGSSLSVSF